MIMTIVSYNNLIETLSHTPYKIMDILTNYHATINKILLNHPKVYLVETLNDTCIFISGAPDRNERHAESICAFARELGFEDIQVRIGIHSGSLIGGI